MIQNNEHGCAPIKLHLWTLALISYTVHKLPESLLPVPPTPPFKNVKTTICSRQTKNGVGWGLAQGRGFPTPGALGRRE